MFCPQCGAPNDEGAIYCGECGAVLNAEAASPVKQYAAAEKAPETVDLFAEVEDTAVGPIPARPAAPVAPAIPARPAAAIPPAPMSTRAGVAPVTSGFAIASLLLGIGGLTILPLIGSVAAIILGYMARTEIRQRPDEKEGDGLALAGIIMGWIAVGLAVLGLVFGIGFGICALCASFGSLGYQ